MDTVSKLMMDDVYGSLIHCASQGDIFQLDSALRSYGSAVDINFQTEGGLNLLMHTVISAGNNINPKGRYLDVVEVLVRAGTSLAVADVTYGRIVLHWAAHYDRDDILSKLLVAGSEDLCRMPDFSGLSPFHLAIQSNSIKCLEVFLAFLPSDILEYPDTQGRKPLTLSVIEGNFEPFVLLLNAGADLADIGLSLLYLAAQCARTEMLELLLKSGQVDARQTNDTGQTIAHIVAAHVSSDMLQVVARNKEELLHTPDVGGITPLMYACSYGIDANVKFLIKKKVALNAVDNEGRGCIHWASESQADKSPKCVQLLCKAFPSSLELVDQLMRTPFHFAAMGGNSKNMDMLVSLGCNVHAVDVDQCAALHWAAAMGQLECMVTSVKLGNSVFDANKEGVLPIHLAASSGNEECLKYLLDAGCNIESKDGHQSTAVHWAVQDPGSITCLQCLFMLGANLNAVDCEGLNALHMASKYNNLLACQYLIESAGCNGKAVDPEGQTALFYSLEGNSLSCMEFLLSRGSNCNHQNNEGRSVAHLAASYGLLEALQLLAQHGADFELHNSKGVRPIHDAAANGQADVLEYLASVGCDIFAQTLDGSTALHYSAVHGHSTCVKMMLDSNFDPNVMLTTEEGDKLTPLDCAEAYRHMETADLIQNYGGKPHSHFATTDKPIEYTSKEVNNIKHTETPKDENIEAVKTQDITGDNKMLIEDSANMKLEDQEGNPSASEMVYDELKQQAIDSKDFNVLTSPNSTDTYSQLDAPNGQTAKAEVVLLNDFSQLEMTTSPNEMQEGGTGGTEQSSSKLSKVKSSSSLFARAISFLKREERKPSLVPSSVALYGAHATILAGATIGTSLGRKVVEVGGKVAKNVAEDLKEEASCLPQTLPALLWEESTIPSPSITPTPPATPSPEPIKAPSPVIVTIDPYEKRIRKAKAQLDEKKTPAFLAIQELLKAEATHVKLKSQFEFARLEERLEKSRQEHKLNEIKAEQESCVLLEKQKKQIGKIQATSEIVHSKIGELLETASTQNAILSFTLKKMGISPKPTVSEWIKKKHEQKKLQMQSNLMSWDIHKFRREEAIKMKQLLTSERATRHAAWETEKHIQQKIKHLSNKKIRNPYTRFIATYSPSISNTNHLQRHIRRITTPLESRAVRTTQPKIINRSYSVEVSRSAFIKVIDDDKSPTPHKMNDLWNLGDNVARGSLSSAKVLLNEDPLPVRARATGPKTYHMGRSLVFKPPSVHQKSRKKNVLLNKRTSVEQNMILVNNQTARYHHHSKNMFIT